MTEPRIRFLLAGVQKGGTSALANYLARNPAIALPDQRAGDGPLPVGWHPAWLKEAHVFDAPDLDDSSTVEAIDARFQQRFSHWGMPGRMYGDATPATLFLPGVIERVARYNPAMRWVVVLRDPVERAISHYFMERGRGAESLPLLVAMLAESWRLRGRAPLTDLAWRRHSYQARSRYRRQLQALYRWYPRSQVLVLSNDDLAATPQATVARVLRFLEVSGCAPMEGGWDRVFEGDYVRPGRWSPGRLWLGLSLWTERRRWRALCTPPD